MTDRPAHLLRRRSADRVIGGVAGGLGDYFNIDPLLIRIGFVGLIIFGGAGLFLYLAGWLLLPAEGQEHSMVEGLIRRVGLTPARIVTFAIVAVAVLLLINSWNTGLDLSGRDAALLAIGVIVLGFVLIRRRDAARVTMVAPATIAPAQVRAAPRPPSPLGWYVLAATLIAVGLLAIVSQVANVAVAPGQFFGAALTVIGIGLVVGAWWGRARILILLALLLLPMAVTASFITAPLEGGVGDQRYAPATPAELRPEYRLMGGRLVLDLTGVSLGPGSVKIAVSVAVGGVRVILPAGASVQIEARVGAGVTSIFDSQQLGTSLADRYVRRHLHATTYILDLEAGIGEVQVITQRPESN